MSDIIVRPEAIAPFGAQAAVRYTVSTTDGTSGESTAYVDPTLPPETRNAAILTDARQYADINLGTTAGANFLLGGEQGWLYLPKRTDQGVINSTTLVDDDTIQFLTVVGGGYTYRMMIFFRTGSIPDFKYRLTHSGTHSNVYRSILRAAAGATPAEAPPAFDFDTADVPLTAAGPDLIGSIKEDGRFVCETAGVVKFQWAQNSLSGLTTYVLRGSYIEVDRTV